MQDEQYKNIPLGLAALMAQSPGALSGYSALSEDAKAQLLRRARNVASRKEMRAIVDELEHGAAN
ncbi:MAG: hypothetical protein LBD02_00750 [Christensenellaceae bacterium]|jgi:hypothetical protein|nr:hypothetical protein [Christensenellaceae bacterium]